MQRAAGLASEPPNRVTIPQRVKERGTLDRTATLAQRGIIGLLRDGVDTLNERQRSVPAAALLLLTWVAVVAYFATSKSAVGVWLTGFVPRDMLFTGAVVALGLSALVAWSRDAKPLALLATMLLAYVGGTVLSGHGVRVVAALELRGWTRFAAERTAYGTAVAVPMLAVYVALRHWWERFQFGVGRWSGRTRLFLDAETPITWARALLTVTLWIGVPFFLVMQLATGFGSIRSGGTLGMILPAVALAVVNAVVEEVIFRGCIQHAVVHCAGPGRGLWLQGLFFGAHHIGMSVALLATLPAAGFIGIGGVLFGKSALETRGLGWAVVAHAVFDIGVFAAYGFAFGA